MDEEEAQKPEPKISIVEAIGIGLILIVVSLINLIPLAGDFTSVIAGALMTFYLYRKGLWGTNILIGNGIGYVCGFFPVLQEFPTELAAWIFTVIVDRFPRLEAATEKVGALIEPEEGLAGAAEEAKGAASVAEEAASTTENAAKTTTSAAEETKGIASETGEAGESAGNGERGEREEEKKPSEKRSSNNSGDGSGTGSEGDQDEEEEDISATAAEVSPYKEANVLDFPNALDLSKKPKEKDLDKAA